MIHRKSWIHKMGIQDKQYSLEDLANLALGLEEKLFPELDEIKKEMEEKKQSSIQKNSDSSNSNI